ncbi:MAG: CCA tRNA nucleotidyltransferase [Fibrobacterota bacterium]
MSKNNLNSRAVCVVRRLQEAGFTALYAGGAVRDMLLGKDPPTDIDIATDARPADIRRLFSPVHAVGESFGVMLVVQEGTPFEVATFRSEAGYSDGRHPDRVDFATPREDAQRRDFTINGLFYDPLRDEVYDYVGGEADLRRGIIRTIGDPHRRFSEDYLRLLRAVRFSGRFDFPIEANTWQACCSQAHKIAGIAAERIFQELTKTFTGPAPLTGLDLLSESGLLRAVLPEVENMKGVEQPPEFHPEGDVFAHTRCVLADIGAHPSAVLAWGALLHDVGKPPTQTFEDRIRFNRHNVVGGRMAEDILRRLKAPKKLIEGVRELVENHMSFIHVQQMRMAKLKRFLGRKHIEDELALHRADCHASHGNSENYDFLRRKQEEFSREELLPDPLIGGRDLIALGMRPSPRFGTLIQEVYDLQLEDRIRTKEQALQWIREHRPCSVNEQ